MATSRDLAGPTSTRIAKPIAAATIPPRDCVIHRASTVAGIAATASARAIREAAAEPNQTRTTIAVAIAAASPFQ